MVPEGVEGKANIKLYLFIDTWHTLVKMPNISLMLPLNSPTVYISRKNEPFKGNL